MWQIVGAIEDQKSQTVLIPRVANTTVSSKELAFQSYAQSVLWLLWHDLLGLSSSDECFAPNLSQFILPRKEAFYIAFKCTE